MLDSIGPPLVGSKITQFPKDPWPQVKVFGHHTESLGRLLKCLQRL